MSDNSRMRTSALDKFVRKKRLQFIASLLTAIPCLLFVSYAAAFKMVNIEEQRSTLQERASQMLGNTVVVEEDVKLRFFPPIVDLHDVRVLNPEWTSKEDMARLEQVSLKIDFLSLLQKKVRVKKMYLEGGKVHLEAGVYGETNWSKTPGFLDPIWVSEEDNVTQIEVEDINILYHSSLEEPEKLVIEKAVFKTKPGEDISLYMDGLIWEDPFKMQIKAGSFQDLQDRAMRFPVHVTISSEEEEHAIKVREEAERILSYYGWFDLLVRKTDLVL